MNRYIQYQMAVGKQKPNTVNKETAPCPFCDREKIKKTNRILIEKDGCLLIENKYPAFEDCYQTVFVESESCHGELSNYSKNELYSILDFGLKQWISMSQNPKFQSVIFLKNRGRYSGASIHHPHMQIVGLENVDYRKDLLPDYFEGHTLYKNSHMEWNISTKPISEFYEFNVILSKEHLTHHYDNIDSTNFHLFCDALQDTVDYCLHELNTVFQSYNLTFYEHENRIIVKIIPRGFGKGSVSSALLLGYKITQVPSDIKAIATALLHFSDKKRRLR